MFLIVFIDLPINNSIFYLGFMSMTHFAGLAKHSIDFQDFHE